MATDGENVYLIIKRTIVIRSLVMLAKTSCFFFKLSCKQIWSDKNTCPEIQEKIYLGGTDGRIP